MRESSGNWDQRDSWDTWKQWGDGNAAGAANKSTDARKVDETQHHTNNDWWQDGSGKNSSGWLWNGGAKDGKGGKGHTWPKGEEVKGWPKGDDAKSRPKGQEMKGWQKGDEIKGFHKGDAVKGWLGKAEQGKGWFKGDIGPKGGFVGFGKGGFGMSFGAHFGMGGCPGGPMLPPPLAHPNIASLTNGLPPGASLAGIGGIVLPPGLIPPDGPAVVPPPAIVLPPGVVQPPGVTQMPTVVPPPPAGPMPGATATTSHETPPDEDVPTESSLVGCAPPEVPSRSLQAAGEEKPEGEQHPVQKTGPATDSAFKASEVPSAPLDSPQASKEAPEEQKVGDSPANRYIKENTALEELVSFLEFGEDSSDSPMQDLCLRVPISLNLPMGSTLTQIRQAVGQKLNEARVEPVRSVSDMVLGVAGQVVEDAEAQPLRSLVPGSLISLTEDSAEVGEVAALGICLNAAHMQMVQAQTHAMRAMHAMSMMSMNQGQMGGKGLPPGPPPGIGKGLGGPIPRPDEAFRDKRMVYKTRLCMNLAQGQCTYGARCTFAHGEHELRQPMGKGGLMDGAPDPDMKGTLKGYDMKGQDTKGIGKGFSSGKQEGTNDHGNDTWSTWGKWDEKKEWDSNEWSQDKDWKDNNWWNDKDWKKDQWSQDEWRQPGDNQQDLDSELDNYWKQGETSSQQANHLTNHQASRHANHHDHGASDHENGTTPVLQLAPATSQRTSPKRSSGPSSRSRPSGRRHATPAREHHRPDRSSARESRDGREARDVSRRRRTPQRRAEGRRGGGASRSPKRRHH